MTHLKKINTHFYKSNKIKAEYREKAIKKGLLCLDLLWSAFFILLETADAIRNSWNVCNSCD